MKRFLVATVCLSLRLNTVTASNTDRFSFRSTEVDDEGNVVYGMEDWGDVKCTDTESCLGWPDRFEHAFFEYGNRNNCRWCPKNSTIRCGMQRQSPINLERNRAVAGHPRYKDCPDWHWMKYKNSTCGWDVWKNHFSIEPNGLKIHTPINVDGQIDCDINGTRKFPRLDYSQGFPQWWFLQRTEIAVPSHHTQEGKQYAAEVTLAHFYSEAHHKNEVGYVSIFLEPYTGATSWPFLDKLICQWRLEEEKVRSECGYEPAPQYPGCRLHRDQVPLERDPTEAPTHNPTFMPTERPSDFPTMSNIPSRTPSKLPSTNPTLSAYPTITVAPSPIASERPTFLSQSPTSFPTHFPTIFPTESPSESPTDLPSMQPSVFQSESPSNPPSADDGIPPVIDCDDYENQGANIGRMCRGCCNNPRSATDFCWASYDIFGENIHSACYHCCDEPKEVGKYAHVREDIEQIDCTTVDNPHRICLPTSCCNEEMSTTSYCKGIYEQYGSDIRGICWYCCSDPKEVNYDLDSRRLMSNATVSSGLRKPKTQKIIDRENSLRKKKGNDHNEESKIVEVDGQKFVLSPENFEDDGISDDDYFESLLKDYKMRESKEKEIHRRVLEEQNLDPRYSDYADVDYWPYEWLLKVNTEYYFRYEGTQVAPPCKDKVHWRVLKDPIRVHFRQIAELERLIAWRIAPRDAEFKACQNDTAGRAREGSEGMAVNVNRTIQRYHNIHRKVFCECTDWQSHFVADRRWCRGYRRDANYTRFYKRPYNFFSGDQF